MRFVSFALCLPLISGLAGVHSPVIASLPADHLTLSNFNLSPDLVGVRLDQFETGSGNPVNTHANLLGTYSRLALPIEVHATDSNADHDLGGDPLVLSRRVIAALMTPNGTDDSILDTLQNSTANLARRLSRTRSGLARLSQMKISLTRQTDQVELQALAKMAQARQKALRALAVHAARAAFQNKRDGVSTAT